jgi:hypothetical protein
MAELANNQDKLDVADSTRATRRRRAENPRRYIFRPTIRYFSVVVLTQLLTLLTASQCIAQQIAASALKFVDSGFVGRVVGLQDIYWIDDELVLFVGRKPGEIYVKSDGRRIPNNWIHVWNINSGKVKSEAYAVGEIRNLCYQSVFSRETLPKSLLPIEQGFVRYGFEREGVSYKRFGRLFVEREVEVDTRAIKDGLLAVSPISCREFNPAKLRNKFGVNPLPLLEPGEYLDRGTQPGYGAVQPLRYFPSEGHAPISLPNIPVGEVIATPRYSDYTKTYVFQDLRPTMGSEIPARLWLLSKAGAVEEYSIPTGPWMDGVVRAMPTRKGLFVTSTAIGRNSPKAAGGYLISGTRAVQILSGLARSFSISPDGCRIAISISTYDADETPDSRIGMVDVCKN